MKRLVCDLVTLVGGLFGRTVWSVRPEELTRVSLQLTRKRPSSSMGGSSPAIVRQQVEPADFVATVTYGARLAPNLASVLCAAIGEGP